MTVRLRRRRRVCGECGQTGRAADPRPARQALAAPGSRRQPLHRSSASCAGFGARTAAFGWRPVPWARPGAHHTRDFEDVVAWLAQQMAFAPIARLLRVGWHTIGPIVARVVADHLDEDRLDGLVAIGVDEISYRRHHRYLTSVADHAPARSCGARRAATAPPCRASSTSSATASDSIRAVSIDMSGEYQRAIRDAVPDAEICFDPFHVVRLGAARHRPGPPRRMERATTARTPRPAAGSRAPAGRCSRRPRTRRSASSPRSPKSSTPTAALYRAFLLREELRLLYHLPDPALAPAHLDAWLAWASALAAAAVRPARAHPAPAPRRHPRRDPPRPLQRPPRGPELQDPPDQPPRLRLPQPRPLIALVYLCCAGITIELPR